MSKCYLGRRNKSFIENAVNGLTSAASQALDAKLTASSLVVADLAARSRTSRLASHQRQFLKRAANSRGSRPAAVTETGPTWRRARARPLAAASAPRAAGPIAKGPTHAHTPRLPPSTM